MDSSTALPSWLGTDKWYVKAGIVVAAAAAVTFVGWAHEKIYGDEAPPQSGMGGFGGLPPELLSMLAAAGAGGPPGAGGKGPAGGAKKSVTSAPRHALAAPPGGAPNRSRQSAPSERQYEMRLTELVASARMAKKNGELLKAQEIYSEVIELVDRVSQRNPAEKARMFQPLQELAEIASQLGDYARAELALRRTIELIIEQLEFMPNNPNIHNSLVSLQLQLAQILTVQSKLDQAQQLLEALIETAEEGMRPNERGSLHSIYKRLISVCLSQGLFDKCEQLCAILEGLPATPSAPGSPSNSNLVLGSNKLIRGLVKLRQKHIAAAKDIFESVLAQFVPRAESNSQKLTDITLRKSIASYYSEESESDLAQEQYMDIYTRYKHFLDGGRTASEETKTIRAAVYEALNDMVSELHNNGKDEVARRFYEDFISRKCAVLSQSRFFHTNSAKIMYDTTKKTKNCVLVYKLVLVRDPSNMMKPFVPPGAVLVIKAEALDDWEEIQPVAEPAAAEPDVVAEPEPAAAEPEVVAEPAAAEPEVVAEPVAAEPEPAAAESEPAAAESEPAAAEPEAAAAEPEAAAAEPEAAAAEPEVVAAVAEPEAAAAEPEAAAAEPEAAAAEPEAAVAEPEAAAAEPEAVAEPEATAEAEAAAAEPEVAAVEPVAEPAVSAEPIAAASSSASSSSSSSSSSSTTTESPAQPKRVAKVRTYEVLVTKEMVDACKITLEFPAENHSREYLYEIGITVYSDASKNERIGYHHQLLNCLVDTHDISPSTFQHQIESRQLRYSPSPDAIHLTPVRS